MGNTSFAITISQNVPEHDLCFRWTPQKGSGSDWRALLDQGRPPLANHPKPSLLLKKERFRCPLAPLSPPTTLAHSLLASLLTHPTAGGSLSSPVCVRLPQALQSPLPCPCSDRDGSLARLAWLAWVLTFGGAIQAWSGSPLHSPGSPKVHTVTYGTSRRLSSHFVQLSSHF